MTRRFWVITHAILLTLITIARDLLVRGSVTLVTVPLGLLAGGLFGLLTWPGTQRRVPRDNDKDDGEILP